MSVYIIRHASSSLGTRHQFLRKLELNFTELLFIHLFQTKMMVYAVLYILLLFGNINDNIVTFVFDNNSILKSCDVV